MALLVIAILITTAPMNRNIINSERNTIFAIEEENQKPLSYQLSIAYGYASFLKESDKTLFVTLARADKSMYARKKQQKILQTKN